MSALTLRDYQTKMIEDFGGGWAAGARRIAGVLPTGGGKTVIFGKVALDEVENGGRVCVLVHRDELARQAVSKVRLMAPGVQVGTVKAEVDEYNAPIVVASVQTIVKESRQARIGIRDLVIVDECHHATAKSYTTILDRFGCFDSGARALGVTATLMRGDGAALGDVWETVVEGPDILDMIRGGHLVDPKGVRVDVADLDFSKVRKTAGDYSEHDLGEALEASMAPEVTAEAYLEHAKDKSGIIFTPTVETARLFADAFNDAGIVTAVVWGAMPTDERRKVLKDFDEGRIQVLSNCMVLTEGFDSPRAEVCVIARPTASAPLYIQMVGRVLRPFPGKRGALILDVVGAGARHVLQTLATLAGSKKLDGVSEGQTLLEAWDAEEDEIGGGLASPYYHGPAEAKEFDLFGGSRQAWLRTDGGYWFIPTPTRYIALAPMPDGSYTVLSYNIGRGGDYIAKDVPDLSLAMSFGEADITPEESVIAKREASWRKRRASEKTIAFARRLRIECDPSMKGGEVSNMIAAKLASQRIDAKLRGWLERQS